jgi:hypothetical protein
MELEEMSEDFKNGYSLATMHCNIKIHHLQDELNALIEQLYIERAYIKDLKELLDRMRAMMLGLENRA